MAKTIETAPLKPEVHEDICNGKDPIFDFLRLFAYIYVPIAKAQKLSEKDFEVQLIAYGRERAKELEIKPRKALVPSRARYVIDYCWRKSPSHLARLRQSLESRWKMAARRRQAEARRAGEKPSQPLMWNGAELNSTGLSGSSQSCYETASPQDKPQRRVPPFDDGIARRTAKGVPFVANRQLDGAVILTCSFGRGCQFDESGFLRPRHPAA